MPENDPESRLEQLRFLERVQLADLERTRRWIAEEEKRVKRQRRAEPVERASPDWVIQGMINSGGEMVHAGDCWASGGKRTRSVSRDEAVQALARGAEACNVCRSEALLGIEEP